MKPTHDLQDNYLRLLTTQKIPVVIYLVNGVQLRGLVCGYDNFTILLENNSRQEMIYKHAISTISPQKPIQLQLT